MDRTIIYPGAIPLDTDQLNPQVSIMAALGFLMQATFGTTTIADGLSCSPSTVPNMQVMMGSGSITSLAAIDTNSYGSLGTNANQIVKMGVNPASTILPSATTYFTAPTTSGQTTIYLIEAAFVEEDGTAISLPYYNAANPAVPLSGPTQNTKRTQTVGFTIKSNTGTSPTVPAVDPGYVGLYTVTVAYAQTTITSGNIAVLPTAPFIRTKLPAIGSPGVSSGVQRFMVSTTWTVPAGVTQIEAEIWGAGSGSWGSVANIPGGGGGGGGYTRKLFSVTPGSVATITVGSGGSGGVSGSTAPTAGGASSVTIGGTMLLAAAGGSINPSCTVSQPAFGNLAGGNGAGTLTPDCTLYGGDGGNGGDGAGGTGTADGTNGGMGGGGGLGGGSVVSAGGAGRTGYFPGGGASGGGTGAAGTTAQNGATGAAGQIIIRY